jgi:23S rRNA pseudouridine2605 synthase
MCGIASRRKADEMITAKKVRVNGRVIKELGTVIDPENDKVLINNRKIETENKKYIILNKPRLFLTTLVNNEDDKPTITGFINDINERIYPVGRLDYDSEGLLFLTNDGELANRIHHPSYEIKKTYSAIVRGFIDNKTLKKIKSGALLDGSFIRPDSVKNTPLKNGTTNVVITFHEGKKHLVKNYLNYFGFPVERLKRTMIGNLQLGNLHPGKWRDLYEQELEKLKEKTGLV